MALYPSLEARQVADIVYEAVMETTITFEGLNYKEGARYIASPAQPRSAGWALCGEYCQQGTRTKE